MYMRACTSQRDGNHSSVKWMSRKRSRYRNVSANGERRSANRQNWATGLLKQGQGAHAGGSHPQDTNEILAVAESLYQEFMDIDILAAQNLRRVQSAMCKHKVGPHCFAGSTGYGHGDIGRATFDQVFAEVLETEACMARVSMAGADHALSCALFACLRPQEHVTFLTGTPDYSTRQLIQGHAGSLDEWGISCSHVELAPDGSPDTSAFAKEFETRTPRAVVLQRAPSIMPSATDPRRCLLTLQQLHTCQEAISELFSPNECPVIIVDNRYSEFVEPQEPGSLGVDIVTGTFLGSVGGSIVPSGAYVAGKRMLVEKACSQFCAPGMSLDAGAVPGDTLRLLFQGLFLAPGMVSEAQKGSLLLQNVLGTYGVQVARADCSQIQAPVLALNLGSEAKLHALLQAINDASCFPDKPAQLQPDTLGVQHAGGGFVQGCTADIGAYGVMQDPFPCVLYGGTHWSQWVSVLAKLSPRA